MSEGRSMRGTAGEGERGRGDEWLAHQKASSRSREVDTERERERERERDGRG